MLFEVKDLQFGYEDITLLEDVNLTMHEGDRIGLIGANGAGKTTFLRLVLGELAPDRGSVTRRKDLRVGVLHQHDQLQSTGTVWQEMQTAFAAVAEAEKAMRRAEETLAQYDEGSVLYRKLVAEHDLLDRYIRSRDGYNRDVRIKTVLNGMGFADYDVPVAHLSGGEKTRLALSKLLLSDLELLVLDEPTNHLDVDTLGWLEKYLDGYKAGLIIVSHDRYFLDKTVRKVWDVEGQTIREWTGNYTKAKATKDEVVAAQQKAYEKQQQEIADMMDYAERNMARASTSKSAKSRLHRIEGMDIIDKPIVYTRPPRLQFDILGESNRDVLKVEDLALRAGDATLIEHLSFEVHKGEKVAVVGRNGVGKSTLIKTLLGLVHPETDHYNVLPDPQSSCQVGGAKAVRNVNGAVWYGKNLRVSYYDQENLNLDGGNSVLSELWFRFPAMTQTYARSKLANLLFTAEDMDKRVDSLSGGEKAKLGLAVVTCEGSNLLYFDEPTNHLDLMCREALEGALSRYQGTVLFVSHDRYFVNAVATRVLELTESGAKSYEGNYDAYLAAKEKERQQQAATEVRPAPKETGGNFRSKEERRLAAQRRDAIAKCERELEAVEQRIQDLTLRLCAGGNWQDLAAWDRALADAQAEEERLYALLESLMND